MRGAWNLWEYFTKMVHIALFSARRYVNRSVRTPSNCIWSAIFFSVGEKGNEIAFIIERRKGGGRGNVARPAGPRWGVAQSTPSESPRLTLSTKLSFLPLPWTQGRVPSKFPTIDRSTLDHRNDQSVPAYQGRREFLQHIYKFAYIFPYMYGSTYGPNRFLALRNEKMQRYLLK